MDNNRGQLNNDKQIKQINSSYAPIIEKLNSFVSMYGTTALDQAFGKATGYMANMPTLQNMRVKAINSLPCDYSKEDIGDFLRSPYNNEKGLRQTAQILKWTAYPFYRIVKLYQDIPSYYHYTIPLYVDEKDIQTADFTRECRLIDKINREISPKTQAHKIVGQAITEGKVFYTYRFNVDKAHNKVNYAFLQQLPSDWCKIIGFNNVSGYTISFNLMYFMQQGTDFRQFGDLFTPYMDDFNDIFVRQDKDTKQYAYASRLPTIDCNGISFKIDKRNIKQNAVGNPEYFEQNGRFFYYVTLPIDKVWTFEIDDTTVAVASPLSGLMLTYSQQADYEAAQLSLLLNPLIKIFTGEMPYTKVNEQKEDDGYRLSIGGRSLFETFFDMLMYRNNTSGAGIYLAPVENIKSHDFAESANANDIALSFNRYADSKAGLSALLPADDDIKAAQVLSSQKTEAKYVQSILNQFEKMMNTIYKKLNLNYEWEFKFFGDIFSENDIREDCEKALARGDLSAYFKLSAIEGISWLDKKTMLQVIKHSNLTDYLEVAQTSYTQSNKENGRPKTEGITSEAKEKSIDTGNSDM